MGLNLQLAGHSSCNDGLGQSLGRRNRHVTLLACGDIKCLAFAKGLDYRHGKSLSLGPIVASPHWSFGLDFELVDKERSV